MKKTRRFCQHCGSMIVRKSEEGISRDFCQSCRVYFYENPLPVVAAILVEERNVLLVKRGRKPYRGKWCLPCGFAETGENIHDATLRELEEETGIQGRIKGLVDVQSQRNYFYGDLLFLTFEVEQTGGTLKAGSDTVAASYRSLEHIPRLAFPANEQAIQTYIRSKQDYWAIVDSFNLTIADGESRNSKKDFLSDQLVAVIAGNAGDIARLWIQEATTHRSTTGYHDFDHSRLYRGVQNILSRFNQWLGGYFEDSDIEDFFSRLGKGSRKEGFALSEVLSALSLVKKHLWEFALSRGMWRNTIDIYKALELDRRIVIFFDKAAFHTARGYEKHDVR